VPAPRAAPVRGMRREGYRKLIHVASVAVPAAVWVLPWAASAALLGLAVAVALGVEWSRARVRWVRYHFLGRTRTLLRTHERRGLAGATWMAMAYLGALLLFPLPVAVAAMLYIGLGDAAAALVGRRYGRRRTRWGKSWEGFAAGAAVNLGVGLVMPGIGLAAAVAGALAAALLEFLPLPLDDNLRVVLGGGAVLALATRLLG
jgi:dolichol kinase